MDSLKKRRGFIFLGGGVMLLLILGVFLYIYYTGEFKLSEKEMEKYNMYGLSISENTTMEEILPYCQEIRRDILGDLETITLYSNELITYLNCGREIEEVVLIHHKEYDTAKIYITYTTLDDKRVYLIYNEEGLFRLDAFDEKKKTHVSIQEGQGTLQRNFYKTRNCIN